MSEDNMVLSGSEYIDNQLSDIMDYILRDYVYPWSASFFCLVIIGHVMLLSQ